MWMTSIHLSCARLASDGTVRLSAALVSAAGNVVPALIVLFGYGFFAPSLPSSTKLRKLEI